MSRSHHATRRALGRLNAHDFADPERKAEIIGKMRDDLRQKRAVKAAARRAHRLGHPPIPSVGDVEVRALDPSPFVHHPAGEEAVREVLRRLPRGVTDGLASVDLRLGSETQAERAAALEHQPDHDPWIGRAGRERLPGVWSGPVLGMYRIDAAAIELYAYVRDPAHPLRRVWEPWLRLQALATLAHEVAHHHDHTCRVARGRWIARGHERVERYAEAMQHRWTRDVILPYLRERYPRELRVTEAWIRRHGGVALPFEALADDPRVTAKRGMHNASRLFFTMEHALERLMADVAAGAPRWRCRLHFATELHYQDRYDEALEGIARVLRARPNEPEALALRADIYVHQGRWTEALAIAEGLIAVDGDNEDAWETAASALARLERWSDAAAAATRWMTAAEAREEKWKYGMARVARAKARFRAGDLVGTVEDLEWMETEGGLMSRKAAAKLRAEMRASSD